MWIGQCVGWANHKVSGRGSACLINLVFHQFQYLRHVGYHVHPDLVIFLATSSNVDGQVIGVVAVFVSYQPFKPSLTIHSSALSCLFTAMMLTTHVNLILTGKTTVESFAAQDQHHREADVLQREYGYLWHSREKRKVRRKWKEEWGGLPVDARWRFGTARQLWEQEMGSNPLGWICKHFRPELQLSIPSADWAATW